MTPTGPGAGTDGPDSDAESTTDADSTVDEFDRHRRRVLWSLTTGLYLVGSRAGDEVNLMTANLVVQVSMEPKLVAVSLERESVTARLVRAGQAFSLTVLARADRDVVRRFVKPVVDVERAADGTVTSLSGQPVDEVGPGRLPVLASRAAMLLCRLERVDELGSHDLCIGEVIGVDGELEGTELLRMEDTRMHYGG
jgi:flavin reductase (DIM6/NTAB) family NADH-FMN oxidoreductase RutF